MRVFRASLAVGAVAVPLFALWMRFDWWGDAATRALSDGGTIAAALFAGAACLRAAWLSRGAARRAWTMIGLAALAYGAGEAVWTWYEFGLGIDVPFPSLADVGYLATYPLAAAGFLLFTPRQWPRWARVSMILDGLLLGVSLLLGAWVFVLAPLAADSTQGWLARAIGLAYPVFDVALLATIVGVMVATRHRRSPPLRLAALAFACLAAADVGYAYLTLDGTYEVGNVVDAGWLAAFVLLALAASHPDRALAAPERPPEPTWRAALLPSVALAALLAVDAFAIARDGRVDPFLRAGSAAVVILSGLRQSATILDNLRLTRDLKASLARQKELEDSRTHYLNAVVHDLMTPLTIVGMSIVASEDPEEAPARRHAALRSLDQVQRLLNDIRDIARIQAGQLRLDVRDAELSSLVLDAVRSFREPAASRRICLAADVPGIHPVKADAGRLTQVLTNLLSNAVKFSPEGSAVHVSLESAGGRALLRVRDEGPGLDAEQQAKLFQPFSQVHPDPEMRSKGSGLGLSISRAIVERHGGRLWCESDGPGKGATFLVELPETPPPAAKAAPAASPAPA